MFDAVLTTSALLTLSYTDQFFYPLSLTEISERLVLINQLKKLGRPVDAHPSHHKILAALHNLQRLELIGVQNGYYFLAGSKRWVLIRSDREKLSKIKWAEVADCVQMLKQVPWIKGVFVTGSLAANNVVQHDDIDFMIIVQNGRLWLSRLLVMVFTSLAHKRRTWKEGGQDTWCFNMWLEEDTLTVPKPQRNLYTAYEVIQARCVWDVDNIEAKFRSKNNWSNSYFSAHCSQKNQPVRVVTVRNKKSAGGLFKLISDQPLAAANRLAYLAQWLYMRPHKTIEQVNLNKALFHPRDTRSLVVNRWKESLFKLS